MNSANTQQNISQHLTKFRTKREQKNSIRNKLYSQYTTKCCICEHWGSLGTLLFPPVKPIYPLLDYESLIWQFFDQH